jgi:hypothetical protein
MKSLLETKYYTFVQNNSGGTYNGPHYIIIESFSMAHAIEFAEDNTEIYFDGCEDDIDCNCCGDRWNRYAEEYDSLKIYNSPASEYLNVKLYRLDGSVDTW